MATKPNDPKHDDPKHADERKRDESKLKDAPKEAPKGIAPNEPYPTGNPAVKPTAKVPMNEAPPEEEK